MTQLDLDITRNRHKGADTSVEAHQSTPKETREKQRERVLTLMKSLASGLTSQEASELLSIPYTAASARFSELKKSKAIRDSGRRRPTSSGKSARVMVVA